MRNETAKIQVTHYSDPGCPFAYSAMPFITALQWRYGDQLGWRHVLIGLTEEASQYEERGYTPLRMSKSQRFFRQFGMPFGRQPKPRMAATARACRVVVASRLTAPEQEWPVFRALQFTQFTTPLPLDSDAALRNALMRVPGLDTETVMGMLDSDEDTEAYEADRAAARTAAGGPTEFQGKSANTDGRVRYTAPSLKFSNGAQELEAGGFQSFEAYDLCVANLDTSLARRAPAEDAAAILPEFPEGLTTAEVAQIMTFDKYTPDLDKAEDALITATGEGQAHRLTFGHDALWVPSAPVALAQAA